MGKLKVSSLFNPVALYLVGVVQALSPYVLWSIFGKNQNYSYEITYLPAYLWIWSLIFFIAGYKLSRTGMGAPLGPRRDINSDYALGLIFIALLAAMYALTAVISIYGGLPIALFTSGELTVQEANELQASAPAGLFGILRTSQLLLLVLSCMKLAADISNRRSINAYALVAIVVSALLSMNSGKRQGLVIVVVTAISVYGLSLQHKSLGSNHVSAKRVLGAFCLGAVLLFGFEYVGSLRVGGLDGERQSLNYLQLPLINFEWQLQEFDFLKGNQNWLPLVAGLVPFKTLVGDAVGVDVMEIIYGFRYPEPGVGAGAYGAVHLAAGVLGVAAMAALMGYTSGHFYRRSLVDVKWVVPYAIMVWPLLAVHTYQHFINMLYVPIPLSLALAFGFLWKNKAVKNVCS